MSDKSLQEIKDKLTKKKETPFVSGEFLSTGSTLLNLACSGKVKGGLPKGGYYLLAGDSMSGKTFMALTLLAEACLSKVFSEHQLIYDSPENGALMDIGFYFGELEKRLETPDPSNTVEEFYYALDDVVSKKKPFIYVLDSMDAINSIEDEKHHEKSRDAFDADKDSKGTYGAAKAKANKQGMLRLMPHLKETGSILIVISHLTDKLGFGFEKSYRAGGKALRFFASLELWFSTKEKIKKTAKGKEREVGSVFQVKVKKNRVQGKNRSVDLIFYPGDGRGFDDIGTQIEYLLEESHWRKIKSSIEADELGFTGTMEKLIDHIENNNLEEQLKTVTQKVWDEIEELCSIKRKRRY